MNDTSKIVAGILIYINCQKKVSAGCPRTIHCPCFILSYDTKTSKATVFAFDVMKEETISLKTLRMSIEIKSCSKKELRVYCSDKKKLDSTFEQLALRVKIEKKLLKTFKKVILKKNKSDS